MATESAGQIVIYQTAPAHVPNGLRVKRTPTYELSGLQQLNVMYTKAMILQVTLCMTAR